MASRSAIDTIKGYFYQFDLSIERLLHLPSGNDSIEIERIEDIDVNIASETTAVQCKYYAKTEYNHSVIAKPIRFMISHYKSLKTDNADLIRYKIYGHYESGQSKLIFPIDSSLFIEQFLTYTKDKKLILHHEKIGLSEVEIEEFISLLDIDVNAVNYKTQIDNIVDELTDHFSCSKFEAEHYYYNNALNKIKELSVEADPSKRKITKNDFFHSINKKEILFNEWFIQFKGKANYCKNIKNQYFQSKGLSTSPFERVFAFEIREEDSLANIKHLILHIQKKWSKLSMRDGDSSYCPYVYIHGISENFLIKIKQNLRNEGIRLIDGTEFLGDQFKVESITRKATFHNEIKLKVINSLEHVREIVSHINMTKEVYQFYRSSPYLDSVNDSVLHVKIQVSTINDIKEIS